MKIRLATIADSREILKIYAQYIDTPITFEYTLPEENEFAERIRNTTSIYPYLVCEEKGEIVGYAYAHRHKEREAYQWNAELSVYIDQAYTAKGLGKKLYGALIEILKLQGVKTVYGGVTVPNEKSERLHTAMGFSLLGVYRNTGYKCGKWHDVAWFEKAIAPYDQVSQAILPINKVPKEKIAAIIQRNSKDGDIYNRIVSLFQNYPEVLYGFTEIPYSDYRTKYKGALLFAVPHTEFLDLETYSEEKLENLIAKARQKVNAIQGDIERILTEENSTYEIPPVAQSSEETLTAPFSFKFGAVNSGIGWIGKNGVLITEKYGPRVRLAAVLINFDFPIVPPIKSSKCPEDCMECVKACPHKVLKGKQWDIETKRSEIIDYQLCNQKRSLYIKTHDRKHACGFCMVACPYGL